MSERIDVKAILADPELRAELLASMSDPGPDGTYIPTHMVCPRHGAVVPCDGDPEHPGGRRLCDPSLPHCPHNNCGKPLREGGK